MTKPLNLSGFRFGRLVAVELVRGGGELRWRCLCDCGRESVVSRNNLRRGNIVSCGCLAREQSSARVKTHGMKGTPEYKAWDSMRARCNNPRAKGYNNYGGRGISVCDEWQQSFEAFFAHIGQRPSPKHSVDRKDNSKGYEPGNIRWATAKEQQRNRRCNRLYEYDGHQLTVAEIADRTGLNANTIKYRLARGWPEHLAFSVKSSAFPPFKRWGEQ